MSALNFARRTFANGYLSSRMRCTYATRSIFAANIPWTATEEEVTSYFQAKVKVHSVLIPKKKSGKVKGYSIIEVEDEDYRKAISMFNEKQFNGRKLHLSEAKK
ncbi:hypothetical protein DSO57_1008096 [Entomophthora muscae]|uniref:Uncharacterized protein n=1 Tax=Entomophthora muscae TaxID=34485 RepID=A0ACC2RYG4_9FUNG|nr:hypothetical protein DSO57_1008096 [Entomophthora muscae]